MTDDSLELSQLDENEQEVLLGLVMRLVDSDEERSLEEIEALKNLGADLGREGFLEAASRAKRRFTSKRVLQHEVQSVTRTAAQYLIFQVLDDLSMRDGMVAEEAELLKWLAEAWNVDWKSQPIEM